MPAVSQATGLSRSTIGRGLKELDAEAPLPPDRVRRPAAGEALVSATDHCWTTCAAWSSRRPWAIRCGRCCGCRRACDKLAAACATGAQGQPEHGAQAAAQLGYSRQVNRKAGEGSSHPDRDAQFEHINAEVVAAQAAGQPVISVDTKKKELVGDYKNGGSD